LTNERKYLMSYDVSLETTTTTGTGPESKAELYWANMTSNVAPMWRKAGCDLAEFDGKPAADLAAALPSAIAHMTDPANQAEYLAMEPDNGWGHVSTTVLFLTKLLIACREHPQSVVIISR
jgi:predicted HD phosphohydrolase